jgi:hypothetical protein
MLSQELTTELQQIMRTDYGFELSNQEVLEFGEQYLASYEALIKLRLENNKSVC